MQEIRIGNRVIGDSHEPFIIAEVGVHHYNSVELAKHYILQARLAGAHAVKFQTYKASRIAARWAPTYWSTDSGMTQFEIFAERDKLGPDAYRELFSFASEVGIIFLSTPFDEDSAVMLADLGVPAFKIASGDITHRRLLKVVAGFGRPLLLSTGASDLEEVEQAVGLVRDHGALVALLHCSLAYPTTIPEANLGRIRLLRERFPDCVIGYSDHTQPQDSELACPISVALGARVIEKHYTLNKELVGDDHYHAVDQSGLIRLVKNCADTYRMTSISEELTKCEQAARTYARRSVVAARPIPAGMLIDEQSLDFKRPGTGVPPTLVDHLIGKRAKRDLDADELVLFEDVE